jgi:hypothetical protein
MLLQVFSFFFFAQSFNREPAQNCHNRVALQFLFACFLDRDFVVASSLAPFLDAAAMIFPQTLSL